MFVSVLRLLEAGRSLSCSSPVRLQVAIYTEERQSQVVNALRYSGFICAFRHDCVIT